ncbi:ABC transporter permease [Mycobacterium avium subsp. hominissuis]|uniref:Peptide ABC transporter permease n=2 Tax=Mycobacterium avium complex (MAC) TaxID=120793 RepID=A0ABX3TNT5_9MYCO|nr:MULTISPECIES: ABC transporter permease [Mycobacterium avium complex (MAC)]ETB36534.1 ABC transporter permease [Mycobacterium avium subsp. hominissuis 10-5606]APA76615.1 ABC transporter permease [Mycobacterium avium subsp. hominissuis]AXO22804.1 ABC transporter permease [Mycobacterium avium subsp. hominissuis]ETZ36489.1 binding--dependent transport system inner membrane component family protein [Mycobacterium avium MAV_120809_2495]ETZ54568.1 binding--dependent transport system inner membrane
MLGYVLARIGQSAIVLLAVFSLVFWGVSILPADPAAIFVAKGEGYFNPDIVAQVKAFYGYDRPLWVQYFAQLNQVLHGHFGFSLSSGQAVTDRIGGVIGETLKLAATATAFAVLFAVSVTALATTCAPVRSVLRAIPPLFGAVPTFWLGLVVLQVFSVQLGLISLFPDGSVTSLLVAALVLAVPVSAPIAQVLGKNIDATLALPHVNTARAKGGTPGWVIRKHVVKNAAGPALTVTATTVGALLGGSVVTETVFSRSGVGAVLLQAVSSQDISLIQGLVLLTAVAIVTANLAVDLIYPLLDPRVTRVQRRGFTTRLGRFG